MSKWMLWVLVSIVVAATGAALYFLYEEYEEEIWLGESQEARRNPYLAAQRYLVEKGVNIVEQTARLNFDEMSPSDVVFLSEVDSILVSKSQIDKAMQWVEQGGTLIAGVGKESKGYDSILDRFDIIPVEEEFNIDKVLLGDDETSDMSPSERMREVNRRARERKAQQKNQNSESRKPARAGDDDQTNISEFLFDLLDIVRDYEYYRVSLDDDYGDIYLASLDRISLEHELISAELDEWRDEDSEQYNEYADDYDYELLANVSDESGQRFIRVGYGDGSFTAISSSKMWNNDYIGLADHALFFSYLVPDSSRLHFVYNFDVPSLWEILKKYFWELLVMSAVMLALWLWRRGLRVQREIIFVEGQRRSFAEHLQAAAKFLVSNKQYKPLVNWVREDIEFQMRPYYPGFSQLNPQSQVAMLVERTELPEEFIQSWVRYCEKIESQDELVAALKIGNTIRKKL